MNVFGFDYTEAVGALFGTFIFAIVWGVLLSLVRFLFFHYFERKEA